VSGERRATPHATRHPSQRDLGWAAGFLEGEGCFQTGKGRDGRSRSITVTATQVQKEPCERLSAMFGGPVRQYKHSAGSRGQPFYRWTIHGTRARGVMLTLFSLMSPRRKQQIRAALLLRIVHASA